MGVVVVVGGDGERVRSHGTESNRRDGVRIRMSARPAPTINAADHSSDWPGSSKRNFTKSHCAVVVGDGSLVFSYNHDIVAHTKISHATAV